MIGKRAGRAHSPRTNGLRDQALTGVLPPRPPNTPGNAAVALMDWGLKDGIGTVCSGVDGATSLYLSTGGGVIGVGDDPRANAASRLFVAGVEAARDSLTPTDGTLALDAGRIRFVLRVGNDLYGAEYELAAVRRVDHPMHTVWMQAFQVLAWLQLVGKESGRGWPRARKKRTLGWRSVR